MKTSTVSAGIFAIGVAFPAAAQTPSFYVIHNAKTNICTLLDTKPEGTEYSTLIYKTRAEAEAAMRTVKGCATN